ncbi:MULTISPECIES: ATP-dependent helicase [Psychrobacter]|uniref:DNA 3'-5' helicase n=1 Tax=Psychrobacter alimentarius TaxID=261164 RepID=A0ABM5ZWZ0_9GAMM|nr:MULTISPECIES: UvrD-helicase domain-containing protein [Psychrobacter]AMT96591.1 DNA helicase UvrD [Psychrobacter alimentarius]QCB31026.1 ATP-dependent helicase [Psychrobacter sp. PAMC27889]
MKPTIFDTHHYNYPQNFIEMKPKLARLKKAIEKLEANLMTADTDLLQQRLADDLGLEIDYASELNANQLLAATTIEGKVLVIAGAGSGKTKTLTYRTSYLIENGVSPKEILLLTFTRKAANEIKGRAKTLLASSLTGDGENQKDSQALNAITSGTFHSFCILLLRQYSGLLGINPRFTILDTGDSEDAIDLINKEKKYATNITSQAFPRKKTLQKIFSTSRNRRIHIRELIESGYPDIATHISAIEQLAIDFHEYKRANHLYDFDDIIGQVVRHLKTNDKFRQLLQTHYRYVMVDEYQDTNIPQKELIDLICTPESVSLMVVGDDNQSIYAFRGANYENILLFGETYPDAKLIKLEQNYRSTPAVLNYINALSDEITLGYQKQLYSGSQVEGVKPVFCRLSNETKEAKYIADKIIALKSEYDYQDFAVLCRTSFQSNYIQLEFMDRHIPFIVIGGIKFIERRHIKDVLAFVKILYNPNDTISWHRILTLFKGVGSVTATRLTQAITADNNSFEPLLTARFAKKSDQLMPLYKMLSQANQADSVEKIITLILEFYIPVLKINEDNWRERSEDFRVLTNLANEHDSLDSFLENLALDPPNDSVATAGKFEQGEEETDKLTISTIHSAKGLEWPVVFVNALVDGITPHYRSLNDFAELEEERKLFYVACSRAKHRLFLTAPDYFSSYSGYFDKASRFIAELSIDKVKVETMKQPVIESDEPVWW